jgi:hypothetical protein
MRYIMGFLIAIGIIILVFVIIFKVIAGGGGGAQHKKIDLTSYATTDAVVKFVEDGPVNYHKAHRQIQITIGRDKNTVQVLSGYQGKIIKSKSYGNTQAAYNVFLHSLQVAEFQKGDNNPKKKDERGHCATGRRYIYELTSGGQDVFRYWNTSCGGLGSFEGHTDLVHTLFRKQIPHYDKFVQDVPNI